MRFYSLLPWIAAKEPSASPIEMKDDSQSTLQTFLVICGLYFLLSFLSDLLLFSDDLVYNYLSEKLPYNQIEDLIETIKNRKWLAWGLIPILLTKNFFLIAMCFTTGALLYGYESNFKKFFLIAINAEFIFLIPIFLKIVWFSFFETDFDLVDLRNFLPLSVINLANLETLEPWYVYPLRLLNVFELLYWLILAIQLKRMFNKSFAKSFVFVATTYGMGLLLWVLMVMFLIVSVS